MTEDELHWIDGEDFHDQWSEHLIIIEEQQGFDFEELHAIDLSNGSPHQAVTSPRPMAEETHPNSGPTRAVARSYKDPSDAALFNWTLSKQIRRIKNQRKSKHVRRHCKPS